MIYRFLDWQAHWLKDRWHAEAQLRFWVIVFWLCVPIYFAPIAFGGSWLTIFIYWLSVGALHLTAMTGITAAETLVETRTEPPLQEHVRERTATHHRDPGGEDLEASSAPAPTGEDTSREA